MLTRMENHLDKIKVCYCGIPGSYGEEAAYGYFGEEAEYLMTRSFRQAFEEVVSGNAKFAVLPVENSSTGSINAVFDLLSENDCRIVGEYIVKVKHCIMTLPGVELDEITEVFSHEQGFLQSEYFLDEHPSWKLSPLYNTAAAAEMVKNSKSRHFAAIASRRAAELYGLEIKADNINFKQHNDTRFVVIAKDFPRFSTGKKLSIMFTVPHSAGALCDILLVFKKHNLNMVRIESRPIPGKNWEYLFFVDFLRESTEVDLSSALSELLLTTSSLRLLGQYDPALERMKQGTPPAPFSTEEP